VPAFSVLTEADRASVVAYMLQKGVLAEDQGILWLGEKGEDEFGRKNFPELFSVFQTPPLFTVRYGQTDLGEVHESSFLVRCSERPVLLLAGRSWMTTTIDWLNKVAYVEPTEGIGRSRWLGAGQPLSFAYCQAIKQVLCSDGTSPRLSRRAITEIEAARAEFTWLSPECTSVVSDTAKGSYCWWTFGGLRANAMLREGLKSLGPSSFDNLSVRFDGALDARVLEKAVAGIQKDPPKVAPLAGSDRAIDHLKFSTCVPRRLAEQMLAVRLADPDAVIRTLEQPLRAVLA
jgi:ATP-dependent Lhr-like helicase